jgi:molybdate transport system substrate-binding protein
MMRSKRIDPAYRRFGRSGRAGSLSVLIFGAIFLLGVLILMLALLSVPTRAAGRRLVLYCAAGLRGPVAEIAAKYREEYGVAVEIQYGGSNTLLSQIAVNRGGPADLYLAGDDFYTDRARAQGLADETIPVAVMRPVIAVAKGNPKRIGGLGDLLREDVRVALGNPEQAAVGRAVEQSLASAARLTVAWEALRDHVTANGVFKPTVSEVANDVKVGAVDAGIIWNATAAMPAYREHLDAIEVPAFAAAENRVTVAVLRATRDATAALHFARYLSARDRGLPVFAAHGFEPVDGDVWADRPEITFFCGAVNRRAVDDVIKAFSKREGVTVNTVYNGCGILTGQMRTLRDQHAGRGFPDVYMACDRYYLKTVADWFQEDVDVSDAAIVIAVPRGNPAGIQSLEDLTKAGVRVALGQPEQCTIGVLTRTLLENENLLDRVMKNVVMQTASSAMLVPAVATGSVDAAIAYVTDTIAESDKVDAVQIDSPYARAVQPFSIARSSDHKQLARRLFEAIAASRETFESAGFHFRLGPAQTAPATQEGSPS